MDSMLSQDQREFKEYCRRFTSEKVAPLAEHYGETDDIPKELIEEMAKAGLFKLLLPEEMGGGGAKAIRICLAREQLAGVYCPADVTLAMQGLGSYPIFLAGNADQKETYLGKIGRGEILTTYALTEPEAGSDVNGMKSTAVEGPEGFELNGEKVFISNGHAAHIVIVFAKTPSKENPRAMAAFVLEKGTPGFQVTERLKVLAPHDLVRLTFDQCVIPRENLLGRVGDGFRIAMKTLEVFRMSVGAAALGIGQKAFDLALAHSKKRKQFGNTLANFQATRMKLADMATELEASRALVYRAALLKDSGGMNVARAASMAKLYATEAVFRIVDQAVQIHGGVGVLHGSTVERLYREIRAMRIYEGTTEIQKLIIANTFLKG
jgi:acyl-CoA dehydrogenase